MITIWFSQCSTLDIDSASEEAMKRPVIPRLEFYESLLLDPELRDEAYYTYDELFVLLAQKLYRESSIKVKLVSVCECFPTVFDNIREITLDGEGDMLQDPHHGFFPQRLPLLR